MLLYMHITNCLHPTPLTERTVRAARDVPKNRKEHTKDPESQVAQAFRIQQLVVWQLPPHAGLMQRSVLLERQVQLVLQQRHQDLA